MGAREGKEEHQIVKWVWTDASALWQVRHGTDDDIIDSAVEYIQARLEGYTKEEILGWAIDDDDE